ncbi:hypothetical protein CA51_28410 [Rosistilla oblonga]|nr:hypothetical protein CA51_28410 [Rosistilla oblonga]
MPGFNWAGRESVKFSWPPMSTPNAYIGGIISGGLRLLRQLCRARLPRDSFALGRPTTFAARCDDMPGGRDCR